MSGLFLSSKLGKAFASFLAALALVTAIFMAGRKDAKKSRQVHDLQGFIDTQERINEVHVSTDRDAALERLRFNNQLRD